MRRLSAFAPAVSVSHLAFTTRADGTLEFSRQILPGGNATSEAWAVAKAVGLSPKMLYRAELNEAEVMSCSTNVTLVPEGDAVPIDA